MKRYVTIVLLGGLALILNFLVSNNLSARPAYKFRIEAFTKDTKAADAIKEAKCNTCHNKSKKNRRNEFGQALNKSLNEDLYKQLKDGDKAEMEKKIDDAIKATLKEKSNSGKTFGELIDSGKLPAENLNE